MQLGFKGPLGCLPLEPEQCGGVGVQQALSALREPSILQDRPGLPSPAGGQQRGQDPPNTDGENWLPGWSGAAPPP